MDSQIIINGKKYNLVPVEEQERILICEINGMKYYLGPEADKKLSWGQAKECAEGLGGELMSQEVGILAFKNPNIRKQFRTECWYWLGDEYSSSYGWMQGFEEGDRQEYSNKAIPCAVRVVYVEKV